MAQAGVQSERSQHAWQFLMHDGPQWLYQCSRCGMRIAYPEALGENPRLPNGLPGCSDGAPAWQRYGTAVYRWMRAGRPVRTAERIREIFETICTPCEHFDREHQRCRLCGCRVRPDGSALANKLRMATERCPADPPKWTEEVLGR